MNSIKLQNRMDAIFMNSENSKTCKPYRLSLIIGDKKKLKEK